jgi:hypothetical protein
MRAPLRRAMKVVGATILLLGAASARAQEPGTAEAAAAARCQSAAPQDSLRPLFYLERNKNKNIVCYDARIGRDGRIDRARVATVYWIMRARDGQYEGLNWIERWRAYGFDLERDPSDSAKWQMTMRAYRTRPVTIREWSDARGASIQAELKIDGRDARFDRIYICARERRLRTPEVRFVDLFGTDLETGDTLRERVHIDSWPVEGSCSGK